MKRAVNITALVCFLTFTSFVKAQNDTLKTSASTTAEASVDKNSTTTTLKPMPHETSAMEFDDKEMENGSMHDPKTAELYSVNLEPKKPLFRNETNRLIAPQTISEPSKNASKGAGVKVPNTSQNNLFK
ncbi:hypothetical protein [Altibacter sp.]|uniref:hypothetical protein n=1 Tax=Altibacter sp. TaxID=2024823 RepID=UPI000C8F2348|nr:hypothetical protein [Altibacter sp.]MAP54513.1 hypothetical protein [Altibacter sp.]